MTLKKRAPFDFWRLVWALSITSLCLACGGEEDSGGTTETPNPCGTACPAEQCRFGMCVVASTSNGTTGGTTTPDPMCADDCAQPDPACEGDTLTSYSGAGTCVSDDACDFTDVETEETCEYTCDAGACTDGDAGATCADEGDCQTGHFCDGAACAEGCDAEEDCEAGFVCNMDNNTCEALAPVCDGGCGQPEDRCEGEDLLTYSDAGDCVADDTCDFSAVETRETCEYTCEAGACTDGETGSVCLTGADCVLGRYCDVGGVCAQGCDEPGDCDSGFACNMATNACEALPPECDDDCAQPADVCDGEDLLAYSGAGACVDDDTCDFSAVETREACDFTCDAGACTNGAVGAVCNDASDCETGNFCDDGGLCAQGCDEPGDCGEDFVCNMANNACENRPPVCGDGCPAPMSACDGEDRLTYSGNGACVADDTCDFSAVETRETCDFTCDVGVCTDGAVGALCRGVEDCQSGAYCNDADVCADGCDEPSDCEDGFVCNMSDNICEERDPVCDDGCPQPADQCDDGDLLTYSGAGDCVADDTCDFSVVETREACDFTCDAGACTDGDVGDVCDDASDCETGNFCDDGGLCAQGCDEPDDCDEDFVCNMTNNTCEERPPVCDDDCSQPVNVCDGEDLLVYSGDGACVADDTCDFSAVETRETCEYTCDAGACTDGEVGDVCDNGEDCESGNFCDDGGLCAEGCDELDDCDEDFVCNMANNTCEPRPPECDDGCPQPADQCDDGDLLTYSGVGACVADDTCDFSAVETRETCEYTCDDGACTDGEVGDVCDDASDCESGNFCDDGGLCAQGCDEPSDCEEDFICNMANNTCEPRPPECADNCAQPANDCEGDVLTSYSGGGECVADDTCDFTEVEAEETCDFTCDSGACTDGTVGSVCLDGDDCLTGAFCSDAGVCTVGCDAAEDCGLGQVCDTEINACMCDDDTQESNDSVDDAAPISEPGAEALALCSGNADWFEVFVPAGATLSVTMRYDPPPVGGVFMVVIDTDSGFPVGLGAPSLCDGLTCLNTNPLTPLEDKLYAIQIEMVQGPAPPANALVYDLDIDLDGVCADDPFEPNDTLMSAEVLPSGCRARGSICVGDEDWFEITTDTVDEVFSVAMYFFNADGDIDLLLYRDDNGDGAATPDERIDTSRTANSCESVSNAGETGATRYWLQVVAGQAQISNEDFRLVRGLTCLDDEPQLMLCE